MVILENGIFGTIELVFLIFSLASIAIANGVDKIIETPLTIMHAIQFNSNTTS